MKCRACSEEHSPLVRCEVAAAINRADVANENVANSSTYRYRDAEARREYQRGLMRRRRAGLH